MNDADKDKKKTSEINGDFRAAVIVNGSNSGNPWAEGHPNVGQETSRRYGIFQKKNHDGFRGNEHMFI